MACAFNGLGFGTIAPGASQRWWISHGGGDCGAQFNMANPLNPGGSLDVNSENKTHNFDGTITYWVTVTNVGGFITNFNWSGGGMS